MTIGNDIRNQRYQMPNDSKSINQMGNIVDILRRITFDKQQFSVQQTSNGIFVRSNIVAPETVYPGLWDITNIVGPVVTVGVGAYRRAGEIVLTTPPTDVTVTADHDWIYWEYNPETNYVIVATSTETGTTPPYDADGKIRGPLYQMRYVISPTGSEVVTVERDWRHILNTSQFAR